MGRCWARANRGGRFGASGSHLDDAVDWADLKPNPWTVEPHPRPVDLLISSVPTDWTSSTLLTSLPRKDWSSGMTSCLLRSAGSSPGSWAGCFVMTNADDRGCSARTVASQPTRWSAWASCRRADSMRSVTKGMLKVGRGARGHPPCSKAESQHLSAASAATGHRPTQLTS